MDKMRFTVMIYKKSLKRLHLYLGLLRFNEILYCLDFEYASKPHIWICLHQVLTFFLTGFNIPFEQRVETQYVLKEWWIFEYHFTYGLLSEGISCKVRNDGSLNIILLMDSYVKELPGVCSK